MTDTDQPVPNRTRQPKTDLDSRTFKDGAIYLYRRADYKKPTWFCRIKVTGAKGYVHASTKTTDEHAAYKFADDLFLRSLAKVHSGQDIQSKRVAIALREFIGFIEKNEKPSQSRVIKLSVVNGWDGFFGNKRLKEITTATLVEMNQWISDKSIDRQIQHNNDQQQKYEKLQRLEAFRPSRNRKNARTIKPPAPNPVKPLSPNTIKRITNYQRQFFNWCVERAYLDIAPKFPKVRAIENRRPHFDDADWGKLVRHLREFIKHDNPSVVRDRKMLRDYVLIVSNTGLRVGEARNLKWRDLREIPKAESNEAPDIALSVKGKTGVREVVATKSEVKTYFKRLLELRSEELQGDESTKKTKPDGNDYVFCNRDGTPVGSFKKSFESLLKAAGVETDSHGNKRTIYSLRHTYATFRLQEGVHQFILAKNMGTSIAMLEKHYGHTSNVASAAELTKGGTFRSGKKAKAVDWL
jgi:integrase